MKIVIDIPEDEYNTGQLLHYFGCYSDKLDLVIYNGTPLPKGHGRLIDADDIALIDEQFYVPSDYYVAESAIDHAPTIIEAEEEGK